MSVFYTYVHIYIHTHIYMRIFILSKTTKGPGFVNENNIEIFKRPHLRIIARAVQYANMYIFPDDAFPRPFSSFPESQCFGSHYVKTAIFFLTIIILSVLNSTNNKIALCRWEKNKLERDATRAISLNHVTLLLLLYPYCLICI